MWCKGRWDEKGREWYKGIMNKNLRQWCKERWDEKGESGARGDGMRKESVVQGEKG